MEFSNPIKITFLITLIPFQNLKYKPKPRDCELTMNPVCGSDGKSYGSECFLNVNKEYDPKLHVAYKGWCKQKLGTPKICPLVYAPVCGTDGETYSNSCFLKAQKKLDPSLQIKHSGECNDLKPSTPRKKLETFTVCTLEYDPVCGTDGETYANSCSFRAQKKLDPSLQIKHSGKCNDLKPSTPRKKLETFTICTLEYDPVCGTDGKTYGNSCFFRAQKKLDPSLQIKHSGECNDLKPSTPRKKLETFTVCTLEYDPMCGTDGETYDNSCSFRAQKKLDPSLQINHLGKCNDLKPSTPRKKLETFTICTLEYDPVCGTDGKTYGNSCFFRAQKKLDPSLQIKHSGECNDIKRSTPRKKWDLQKQTVIAIKEDDKNGKRLRIGVLTI
ncbi:hypothetical protein ABMA27_013842 [Loxostege sticticalis]|uniref:Kazal-like domain-containing protein n=1 Tax=Loxostege sticticalis TaxID=481309 RepID=A0ABR3IBP8_LOXSC